MRTYKALIQFSNRRQRTITVDGCTSRSDARLKARDHAKEHFANVGKVEHVKVTFVNASDEPQPIAQILPFDNVEKLARDIAAELAEQERQRLLNTGEARQLAEATVQAYSLLSPGQREKIAASARAAALVRV